MLFSLAFGFLFFVLIVSFPLYFGCSIIFSTTCGESRPKYKCYFDCLPHCLRGLLPICQADSTFRKCYICSSAAFFLFLLLMKFFYLVNLMSILMQETMSNEHAMRFPLVGSAMLLSLFLLFKFLSKDLVNAVLTCYFFVLGIVALSYVL